MHTNSIDGPGGSMIVRRNYMILRPTLRLF